MSQKSYTLANWDGNLSSGALRAENSEASCSAWDGRGGVELQPRGTTQKEKSIANGHIPVHDTHQFASGSTSTRENRGTGNPRVKEIQHANGVYNGPTLSATFTVNGYTTRVKNNRESSAPFFIQPPSNHVNNVLRPEAKVTPSRTPVPPRSHFPAQVQASPVSRNPQITLDALDGPTTSNPAPALITNVPAMDVDDDGSSADAEGEEVDDDSEDANIVNDMLLNPDRTSCSPAVFSVSLEDAPLSPLFTPLSSPQNDRRRPVKNPFSRWSPSPLRVSTTLTLPPKVEEEAPIPPPLNRHQLGADIFSLPISTTNPRKQRLEVAKPRGRKRKRLILSHIDVPSLPHTVPREFYRPMSSLAPVASCTGIWRSAKRLAHVKVQKTMTSMVQAAIEVDLKIKQIDDGRDPSYMPSSGADTRKPRNSQAGPSGSANTLPTSVFASSQSISPRRGATFTSQKSSARQLSPVRYVSATPPVVVAAAPSCDIDSSPLTLLPSPEIPISLLPSIGEKRESPAITAAPGCNIDSSPPIVLPSPKIPILSLPPPSIGKKRKVGSRLKEEERGNESDNPTVKKKSRKVGSVGEKEKGDKRKAVVHTNQGAAGGQKEDSLVYCRYNPRRDILRVYFHGIPPTRHSVLAMNTRHVRQAMGVIEVDEPWLPFYDVLVTKPVQRPRCLVWPPLPYELVADDEEFCLGGVLEEEMEPEAREQRAMVTSSPKKRREERSTSQTAVNDDATAQQSVLLSSNLTPPSLSPTVVSDKQEADPLAEEDLVNPPTKPSAKALGKRKAVGPPPSAPVSPPSTPHISAHYDLPDELGRVDAETGGLDQFFDDFVPSLTHPLHHGHFRSTESFVTLSGDRRLNGRYDSDRLFGAFISVDHDPFISGDTDMQESSLVFDTRSTAEGWPDITKNSGGAYVRVSKEGSVVNDTIDPSFLAEPGLGPPTGLMDITDYQHPVVYSNSRSLSPIDTPDVKLPAPDPPLYEESHPIAPKSPTQSPLTYFGVFTPPQEEMLLIDQLTFPPVSPASASGHRRTTKPRRLWDMVDVRDLELDSSSSNTDSEGASDSGYVLPSPSSHHPKEEPVKRKGPRIVSAKELARIQRQKTLEREKVKRLEKDLPLSQLGTASEKKSRKTVHIGPPKHQKAKWERGPTAAYCHHCRTRSFYLKMKCRSCIKLWCNRCIVTKYDDIAFDPDVEDWQCPCCQNTCRCDHCTRKRGEVYVSYRRPGPLSTTAGESKVSRAEGSTTKKSSRLSFPDDDDDEDEDVIDLEPAPAPKKTKRSAVVRVEKPFPPTEIVGTPGSYWAAVYSLTGERIATASVGEGNRTVTVTCSLETLLLASGVSKHSKRVFVGRIQRCWGSDVVHKSTVRDVRERNEGGMLGPLIRGDGKNTDPQFKKRVYVGDPEVLLKRVVIPKRAKEEDGDHGASGNATASEDELHPFHFVHPLSPLSSLSSLSGDEDNKNVQSLPSVIRRPKRVGKPPPIDAVLQLDPSPHPGTHEASDHAADGIDGGGEGAGLVHDSVKAGQGAELSLDGLGCGPNKDDKHERSEMETRIVADLDVKMAELNGEASLTENDVGRAIVLALSAWKG